eukprot:SAG11_NODE_149_length_14661_cov_10.031658_9_plen_80_part_00
MNKDDDDDVPEPYPEVCYRLQYEYKRDNFGKMRQYNVEYFRRPEVKERNKIAYTKYYNTRKRGIQRCPKAQRQNEKATG